VHELPGDDEQVIEPEAKEDEPGKPRGAILGDRSGGPMKGTL